MIFSACSGWFFIREQACFFLKILFFLFFLPVRFLLFVFFLTAGKFGFFIWPLFFSAGFCIILPSAGWLTVGWKLSSGQDAGFCTGKHESRKRRKQIDSVSHFLNKGMQRRFRLYIKNTNNTTTKIRKKRREKQDFKTHLFRGFCFFSVPDRFYAH